MKSDNWGFATRSIHGSEPHRNSKSALNPPIYQTSTFSFDSCDHVDDVMTFKSSDYVYTRGNNPTLRLFEERVADLEEGSGGVAFASGMAAISSTLLMFLRPGGRLLTHRTIYGSSYTTITRILPRYGIECRIGDLGRLNELDSLLDGVGCIYLETPCNPTMEILDLHSICSSAQDRGIPVVVDNTFATPLFQRPLAAGATVVVHSATKYLCGHGDTVAGVAVARDEALLHTLKFDYLSEFGGVLSPFNAWLILRGMKSLEIRMRCHESNAMAVARHLREHPKVSAVSYPGLEEFPGHSLAKSQMSGFGGILSFEVEGGLEAARRVVDSTRLIKLAVSLGDCETLIQIPSLMTHRGIPQEELAGCLIPPGLIRLSLGLEDPEDIICDLDRALDAI